MNRLPLLLLLAACARASTSPPTVSAQRAPATASAPERLRRCAELADSTSRLPVRALPLAVGASPGRLDAYPRDVGDGGVVRAIYRITPDGRGDFTSLQLTGSSDAEFRAALGRALDQLRARPARREGCPLWSRGEFMLKAQVRVRRSNG